MSKRAGKGLMSTKAVRFSTGLLLVLLGSGAGATEQARGRWICTIGLKVGCTFGKCAKHSIAKRSVIDFGGHRYSRCERKQCVHYKMAFRRGEYFVHISILPPGGLMAKMEHGGAKFLETLTIDVTTVSSYGRCKLAGNSPPTR